MRPDFGEEYVKIAACERPFERFRGSLITALERHQGPPEGAGVWKVVRSKKFTLNDGEVDLNLAEPTGVDRRMNQNRIVPFGSDAISGPLAAVGGAIVGDDEHTVGGTIRLLAHDLRDKALERGDASLALATPEQPGTMYIPRGQISQRAGPRIFVLDTDRTPGGGRQ